MFDLVGIGRADAAVTGKPAAYQLVKTRPGFRVLDKQLTTEAYGIAVRKDEPQLKAAFNTALAKIKGRWHVRGDPPQVVRRHRAING